LTRKSTVSGFDARLYLSFNLAEHTRSVINESFVSFALLVMPFKRFLVLVLSRVLRKSVIVNVLSYLKKFNGMRIKFWSDGLLALRFVSVASSVTGFGADPKMFTSVAVIVFESTQVLPILL
jgi:hypothetical protein